MVSAVRAQVVAPQTTVVFQLSRVQNVVIHWRVLVCQVHHQRGLRHPSTNTVSNKIMYSKFNVKIIVNFATLFMSLLYCLWTDCTVINFNICSTHICFSTCRNNTSTKSIALQEALLLSCHAHESITRRLICGTLQRWNTTISAKHLNRRAEPRNGQSRRTHEGLECNNGEWIRSLTVNESHRTKVLQIRKLTNAQPTETEKVLNDEWKVFKNKKKIRTKNNKNLDKLSESKWKQTNENINIFLSLVSC